MTCYVLMVSSYLYNTCLKRTIKGEIERYYLESIFLPHFSKLWQFSHTFMHLIFLEMQPNFSLYIYIFHYCVRISFSRSIIIAKANIMFKSRTQIKWFGAYWQGTCVALRGRNRLASASCVPVSFTSTLFVQRRFRPAL